MPMSCTLRAAGRGLDVGRALMLAIDILLGLADLHKAGIVMADLKPDNILIDDVGKAVLVDFGISKAVTATAGASITSIVGSPSYM